MDDRLSDRTNHLTEQPLLPCQLEPDVWFNDKPAVNLEEVAFAEQMCLDCPLAQQIRCATLALKEGHVHGTWAGVTLPGESARKRDQLAQARARLRRIAGIEQCTSTSCRRWYRVVEHTAHTLAQARRGVPTPENPGSLCPRCAADEREREAAATRAAAQKIGATSEAAAPQIPLGGDPDDDSDLALYWNLRHRRHLPARILRSEWLLITPAGAIEGCYAWHTAARSFGRTDKRFLALLADGWTIRRAITRDDHNWHAA